MGHPKIFLRVGEGGSFLSQLAAGKLLFPMNKRVGVLSRP